MDEWRVVPSVMDTGSGDLASVIVNDGWSGDLVACSDDRAAGVDDRSGDPADTGTDGLKD